MERLKAGEVVVEETRLDDQGGSVRAMALSQANAETTWRVIADCGDARRYVHGLEFCEVLIDEPDQALTHHVVDPGWLVPKMDFRFETRRHPYHRMDFKLTEGNLKKMQGFWLFASIEPGLLIIHELHIQPRAPAPRWLVRRKLSQDLPQMLACIRGLSGGSLSDDLRDSDLASCSEKAGTN